MNDFTFHILTAKVRPMACGCRQYILVGHAENEHSRIIEVHWWQSVCNGVHLKSDSRSLQHRRIAKWNIGGAL
jgi:hypothetical protein